MKREKFVKYLLYFVIFSFLGSLMEYLYGFAGGTGINYDRGLNYFFDIKIFFIPYYGIISLILLFFDKFMEDKKIKILYWGILNAVIITAWEFISGLFCLIVLNERFWDYSNARLNFLGIISVPMFLRWIAIGYLFTFIYKGILKKVIR